MIHGRPMKDQSKYLYKMLFYMYIGFVGYVYCMCIYIWMNIVSPLVFACEKVLPRSSL